MMKKISSVFAVLLLPVSVWVHHKGNMAWSIFLISTSIVGLLCILKKFKSRPNLADDENVKRAVREVAAELKANNS